MRRLLLTAILALAACDTAAAAVTCRSGSELYEQDGVRIFETRDREEVPTWWACSARVRTPRRLIGLSPGVSNELTVRGTRGSRLVWAVESYADGGGGWEAGWFDVRTGRSVHAHVDVASKGDFRTAPAGLWVNGRGDIAYSLSRLDTEEEDEIVRDVAFRRYANGRFGRERILAKLAPTEIEPDTIGLGNGTVTWRAVGAERSLPVEPAPPGDAARAAGPPCVQGRTLYHYGARVFTSRRGTFACHRSRVARVSRKRVRPRNYVETGRFLSFTAADRLFRFDLRTGGLRSGAVAGTVLKVALGGGQTAATTDSGRIVLLPRTGPLRELAALRPEEIEPSTLRLTSTQVRWRERGAAGSARY